MTYTDVFGSATLPPAEYGYASFTLTTNTTFVWPYNIDGSSYPVAKVMDIACDAGNEITLPDCTEVSTGEDFLIRNVGANVLIVKDAAGVQVASVAVGAASYFYLTDNTSAAGVFGVIGFGVGTSTADASSLVGYGIKAVGASLNQAHPVQPTNTGITLSTEHRAKLVVFTGGVATFTLDTAATLGDDYFTMFRNDGTGTATIDPAASELIDGMASMQVQPGESLMLICTGTKWYSVGYGRSTLYQFTQLTKDVSAGGTITLSATEAANKLITFIGNPSAAVEVVVPAVVAVYYTQSAISTAQTITLKTSAGSGVGISQGVRVIALCDGTNVVSAQSAVANTSVSLTDGSALVPSLFFATQTNTGLFKSGTRDVGVTVNGSTVGVFGSTGLQTATIGPNSTQRHTLPAVPSDTVTLNTATQTLTNKTFTSPTITGAALTGGTINNTVIGDITPAAGTFTNLTTTGVINLGHTSDTTLTRSAAGVMTIEGVEVVTLSRAQTLTNKTVALGSNTVSGTLAQFNTAVTDADFASLAGSETLTNKSISGSANTLSNIANAALTNSSVTINGTLVALGDTVTLTASDVGYTPAGTGAVARDVQSKLRESVSVKDFGAVGDGATDDVSSINAASLALSNSGGGALIFPAGVYRIPANGSSIRPRSNVKFVGNGIGNTVLWLDTSGGGSADLIADITGPISYFGLRDMTLKGSWAVGNNAQTSGHLIEMQNASFVDIEDCEFTLSNGFGIALNNCQKVRVVNCRVSKTNRDGIAVWNCPDTLIRGNIISDTDDDCISVHTDDSVSLPRSRVVVTDNAITSSQGIKILGGKSVVVSGNVLNRCYAYGLILSNDTYYNQGNTPGVGVTVTDNVIADVMSRVQGGANDKYYMHISGGQQNAGLGASAPGTPDSATGTFTSLFGANLGNFYANNTDNTVVASPGGYYWNIRGNQLIRTLPAVAAYSDWGYGPLFSGNEGSGEYDGAVSDSALNVNGLLIDGHIKNAIISDNIIATTGDRAIYFSVGSTPPALQFDNFIIARNVVSLFNYGVMWPATTATAQGVSIIDNFFDGDPLHTHTNRGANGTFLVDGLPIGVYCPFSYGFVISRNQFRNVCKPVSTTGANPVIVISDNYLRCDPTAVNFSTSNKGIGFCPRAAEQYKYLIVDSDPASATYGNMLNATLFDSNAMPTTGKYFIGHTVKNNNPSVAGSAGSQYVVSSWLRMNIGSTHVLNTDWRELRCLTGT